MNHRNNTPARYTVRLHSDVWKFSQEKRATRHKNRLRTLLRDNIQDLDAYSSRLRILYHLSIETLGDRYAGIVAHKLNDVIESLQFSRGFSRDAFKWSKMRTATLLLEQAARIIEEEAERKREDAIRRSVIVFRRQLRDTIARQANDYQALRQLPEHQTPIQRLHHGQKN